MEKIGAKETSFLFTLLIISTVILGAVSGFVNDFGTLAYVNVAAGMALTLFLLWFIRYTLGNRSFYSAVYSVYGQVLGKTVMCIIFALTLFGASVRMEMFSDAIGLLVLPKTPRFIIFAVISLCSFFVSFFGYEAITRYSLVCFMVFAAFILVILFFSSSEVEFNNLQPKGTNRGFVPVISMLFVFSDIFYLYFVSDRIKGRGAGVRAVITGGIVTFLIVLFYVLCVPYPVSVNHIYPFYTLASLANTSVIFQRMDGLVFVIWIFVSFVSVGALCLFASDIISRVFSLTDRRALSAPISFLVFLLSYIGFLGQKWVFAAMSFVCFVFLPFTAGVFKFKEAKKCKNL